MCAQFLNGVDPDEVWNLADQPGDRLAAMTAMAAATIDRIQPSATLVLGDTHTVPIFAMASRRALVPVIHVEAGLRSLNPQSIEEVNRKVASSVASLHFAPTADAATFLLAEGVEPARIHVVGNTAIDALASSGLDRVSSELRSGVLLTAHRPTNVDGQRLYELVDSIVAVHCSIGHVTFPVHPRTRHRLESTGLLATLEAAGICIEDPLGHHDLLGLLRTSSLVITDSGGLQEEAAYFGVPAVVLRRSTPRWEGIRAGISTLSSTEKPDVIAAARRLLADQRQAPDVYGVGDASTAIADVLTHPTTEKLLSLDEPDFTNGMLPAALAQPAAT